jgi:predicted TIM-barrel fold metal-dependent hydrolase
MNAQPFSSDLLERRCRLLGAYRQTIVQMRARTPLPIIDVEHHWGGGDSIPVANLIDNMDSNGVALTWLGPNEKHGNASSLALCKQYPSRLVPTLIHGDGPRWHGHDMSLVQELEADAHSGEYFAMGEFESRHYVSNSNNRDIHMPADSDSFHAVFRASQDTGLAFLLHHEAEDALLPELEKMLTLYPGAIMVWCHVGRNRDPKTWTQLPTPGGVEKFILKYPNLHFDILQSGARSVFPPTGAYESVLYSGNKPEYLKPEWATLFNTYPDRFLIGSDVNTFRWNNYGEVIYRLRSAVLRVLSKEAAEKIAFKNAWRLMSGQAWVE